MLPRGAQRRAYSFVARPSPPALSDFGRPKRKKRGKKEKGLEVFEIYLRSKYMRKLIIEMDLSNGFKYWVFMC